MGKWFRIYKLEIIALIFLMPALLFERAARSLLTHYRTMCFKNTLVYAKNYVPVNLQFEHDIAKQY